MTFKEFINEEKATPLDRLSSILFKYKDKIKNDSEEMYSDFKKIKDDKKAEDALKELIKLGYKY